MAATPAKHWNDLSTAWNSVGEFSAAVIAYGVIGWLVDRWLGTRPVAFVAGLFLGMLLGIYVLKKRADQMDAADAARRAGRAPR